MARLQAESASDHMHCPQCKFRSLTWEEPTLSSVQKLALFLCSWLPSRLSQTLQSCNPPEEQPPPVDLDEDMVSTFKANIEALLSNISIQTHRKVSLAVPPWLLDMQSCHIVSGLQKAGRQILSTEYAPEAVFTALGWSMCRIDSDWLPCYPPGRIMTLEYSAHSLTAITLETPRFWLDFPGLIYNITTDFSKDTFEEEKESAMVEWINQASISARPEKVALIGSLVEDKIFQAAVTHSDIANLIVQEGWRGAKLVTKDAVVIGTAKIAKQNLEDQGEDCLEFEECTAIRREADKIAGSPTGSDLPKTEL